MTTLRQHRRSIPTHTLKSHTIETVIARYNEPCEWVSKVPNPQIYTKGSPCGNPAEIEQLPNVGREGHTFAHYIVSRYDTLPEYVVFLQGNPFDHCPKLFEQLDTYKNSPPQQGFSFLALHCVPLSLKGCRYHSGIPLAEVYAKLFGNPPLSREFKCGFGAQTIVSRERIRRHPVEIYEKIRDMLAYSNNPIEGFVIERFWGLVFAPDLVMLSDK
jgi:hypothetical protein